MRSKQILVKIKASGVAGRCSHATANTRSERLSATNNQRALTLLSPELAKNPGPNIHWIYFFEPIGGKKEIKDRILGKYHSCEKGRLTE